MTSPFDEEIRPGRRVKTRHSEGVVTERDGEVICIRRTNGSLMITSVVNVLEVETEESPGKTRKVL